MNPHPIPTLIYELIQQKRALVANRPVVIGVAGAQGSGKTYACKLLEAANRGRFAHFSLDDVYLTRAERAEMAQRVHPLFATRGPPGTHDLDLATGTLIALRTAAPDNNIPLPRFDKARDERLPKSEWPRFRGQPEAILVDGWCLGATPPPAGPPLNAIERTDSDGVWRAAQAKFLEQDYAIFFNAFDAIVFLQPPDWDSVRRWRAEQEAETLGRALDNDDHARLDRFMQHYERLTRHMMAGGHKADVVFAQDANRQLAATTTP